MAVYRPEEVNVAPPGGGFQTGGWYAGRQYWNGTLSDPGVEHPASGKPTSGQLVSPEVNAASAAAQGVSPEQLESYLQQQRDQAAGVQGTPSAPSAGTPAPTGASGAGTTGAGGPQMTATETPNLLQMRQDFLAGAGISQLETDLSDKEKIFIEEKGKINDNPFLSEATRVGRIAKLEQLYNERTANLRGDIATKKADVEMQLNLAMKQFDIDSQVTQQNITNFNNLMSMGAFDNASGETIAEWTRSTGISSDLIYSAIAANKKKNVSTSMITSTADSGEVTVSVVNADTGEIIKQTSLGMIGNAQTGAKPTEADKEAYYKDLLREDAGVGVNLTDIFKIYGGILDPNEIYQLYNSNSMYGPAKESDKELAKYGVKPIKTDED